MLEQIGAYAYVTPFFYCKTFATKLTRKMGIVSKLWFNSIEDMKTCRVRRLSHHNKLSILQVGFQPACGLTLIIVHSRMDFVNGKIY
jgi:hypothetical protein